MALTVNSAFQKFNSDAVNLDPQITVEARSSRDWLIKQLENLPTNIDDFPKLYDGMHIKFGSFARNTKLKPLDDIDLIIALSANGTTYSTITYGQLYKLHVPSSESKLWKLTNDDGSLNSIKVVNKLVNSLSSISQYSSANIHRRGEAATLKLTSKEWNFDIVPALYTDTGYYLIPDGEGLWKASDPRVDQKKASEINQLHDGKILQLIRTIKYWQRRPTMPTMPSYLLENLILDFYKNNIEVSEHIDINLIRFWSHLCTAIHSPVYDPQNFSGNLNTLDYETRTKIATKSWETYVKGAAALQFEIDKEYSKSISKWAEIFGEEFPSYG